jgi:DNA gyrase subunit B
MLLTFFYRYMPGLIDHGYVYIAQPPLYKAQKGKDIRYCYTDKQLKRSMKKSEGTVSISSVTKGLEK